MLALLLSSSVVGILCFVHTCNEEKNRYINVRIIIYEAECFKQRKRLAEGHNPLSASVSPPLVNVLLGNRQWIM